MPLPRLRDSTRIGIALTALVGATYILSVVCDVRWDWNPPFHFLWLGSGAIGSGEAAAPGFSGLPALRIHLNPEPGFTLTCHFDWGTELLGVIFRIPLWIPFFLLAVPSYVLERRDRVRIRRFRLNLCERCGYSLAGLDTGVLPCPECGHSRV